MNMRSTVAAVAVFLLVAGITGCASQAVEDAGATETTEVAETTEIAETSDVEAAPLQAAEPEVEAAPEDPEGEFLEVMHRSADRLGLADASDEQFLAAGSDACEQLDAGKADFEVRVIENEKPKGEVLYEGSRVIATYAQKFLCPEVSPR